MVLLKSNAAAYVDRQTSKISTEAAYKLSRMKQLPGIANGMSSVLKRNAYIQGRVLKPLEEVSKKATKSINILDKLFKKIPGRGGNEGKAAAMSPVLGYLLIFGVGLLATLNTKLIEQRQEEQGRINDRINQNISDVLKTVGIVNDRVKENDKKITKIDERLKKTDIEAYAATIKSQAARDKANDALYEVREGRKKLDARIDEAKKDSNDALYETPKGRQILQDQIDKINKDFSKYLTGVKDNFQERIETTVKGIVKSLDKNTDKIVEHNKAIITLQDTLKVVDKVVKGLPKIIPTTKDLEDFATKLINTKIQPIEKDTKKALTTAEEAQKNGVAKKEYDGTITSLRATYDKSFEAIGAKWNEQLRVLQGKVGEVTKVVTGSDFVSSDSKITKDVASLKTTVEKNKTDLEKKAAQDKSDLEKKINDTKGTLDKKINDTRSDLEKKIGSVPTIDPAEIDKIKRDNEQNKKDVKDLIPRIKEVEDGIKEQEKVNQSAIPKLEEILRGLPLIPGRAADAIRPSIPTTGDIERATGTAICSSLNGGCSGRANADLANNINNNTNNRAGDILGAVNAAENTAQIAMLTDIQNRIGAQIPGGISGKLSRIGEWLHLDRLLNIMIFASTVHNALMLSNDIGQTLLGAINNVLTLIGLKKEDGSSFDIGSLISGGIENLIKSAIGNDNYQALTTAWAKANRIYQASINILNSFQGLASSILTGLEMTAGKVAKIGNALRKSGEVLENAYGWMNPQPKFNRVTQTLESLQNGASTIQMVTQAPLDIINATTELTTATTELTNAIKQDDNPVNKGKEAPEPDKLKADEATAKLTSTGLELLDLDLEADE